MRRIAIALLFFSALAAQADTVKMTVHGMVCSFCAQGIEKRLGALPQTKAVYVNLDQKLVAVEAKPGQHFDEATLRAEVKEAGYEVVQAQASDQSVAAIRAASKSKP
jgi:cation transport ATPase